MMRSYTSGVCGSGRICEMHQITGPKYFLSWFQPQVGISEVDDGARQRQKSCPGKHSARIAEEPSYHPDSASRLADCHSGYMHHTLLDIGADDTLWLILRSITVYKSLLEPCAQLVTAGGSCQIQDMHPDLDVMDFEMGEKKGQQIQFRLKNFKNCKTNHKVPMAVQGPSSPSSSFLYPYRFHILIGSWLFFTGAAFFRVSRQPYNSRVKTEQYETIFKATTLGAVIGGVGLNGGLNKPHSQAIMEQRQQT